MVESGSCRLYKKDSKLEKTGYCNATVKMVGCMALGTNCDFKLTKEEQDKIYESLEEINRIIAEASKREIPVRYL